MYSCGLLMIYRIIKNRTFSIFCYHICDYVFSYSSDYNVVMSSRAPLKTPAWEAKKANTLRHTGYPMYSCVLLIIHKTEYRTERSVFLIMCLVTRAITML